MNSLTHGLATAKRLTPNERAIITAVLSQGWCAGNGSAFASREYPTVDVRKSANAYLTTGDGINQTLSFEFWSEGRNVLSPHGVLIPLAAPTALAHQLATAGVLQAHVVICDSFAVRHAQVSG